MKQKFSPYLIKFFILHCLFTLCVSQNFDFFYFVQQWPASYCDSRRSCCYPTTGRPADDFSIHGLWPNNDDGSWPQNCDSNNPFDDSQISDLTSRMEKEWPSLSCPSSDGLRFWGHEWARHGTCTEPNLDQHAYFQAALDLKQKANLLRILRDAGITPSDRRTYSLESIKEAIEQGIGHSAFVECNVDSSRNHQLYQVYLCVDTSAKDFIDCPVLPHGRCGSEIEFPTLNGAQPRHEEL